jgi:metallo-beta-lactamase domain protein
MIKFCSLYSGSSGNCYYINIDGNRILLDVGKSLKKIREALEGLDENIENIDAILITHEHSDHIQGLKMLCKKHDINIYMTDKTKSEIQCLVDTINEENIVTFKAGDKFDIGCANIKSVKISHDAIDPVMYTFKDKNDNKISIFTDVGEITDTILENIKGSKLAVIEANYEENLLRLSRYPSYLKKRIMGKYGHLSNEEAGFLAKELVKNGTKKILLGHLSKENNTDIIAYQTIQNELNFLKEELGEEIDFDLIEVQVLGREETGQLHIID